MDNIPIIGQPIAVHDFQLCAILTCKCSDSNNPVVIFGINSGAKCNKCGKVYVISKISFDRAVSQGVSGEIGVVLSGPDSLSTN